MQRTDPGADPGADPRAAQQRARAPWVLGTSIAARLPQGMGPLALILLVEERTGSIAAAGLASGAWGLGVAVGQPLWARPAGRGRADLVVAMTALLQAAVLVGMAVAPWLTVGPWVAVGGLAGLLMSPASSVGRTMWPDLAVDTEDLSRLYTWDATLQEVIWIAGPALVAAIIAVADPQAAVLGTAIAGGIGGGLFAVVIHPLWRPHARPAVRQPITRALIGPWSAALVIAVGLGLSEVAVPAAAIAAHDRSAAGWLLAVWSLGSLVGGAASTRIRWRHGPADRIAGLLVLLALGTSTTALLWDDGLPLFAVALFLSGIALAPTIASVYGVIGDTAPPARRTDAFAISTTFFLVGIAVGAAASGQLSEISPLWAFLAATISYLVAATGWWAGQRVRATRPSPQTGSGAS